MGDYFINHDIRIPIKRPVFHGKYQFFLFAAQVVVLMMRLVGGVNPRRLVTLPRFRCEWTATLRKINGWKMKI